MKHRPCGNGKGDLISRLVEELDKQGEPVAWWNGKSKFCSPRDKSWDAKTGGILSFGCNTPLYTAPRELSDDLIESIALNYVGDDDELDIIGFARAILKKASEK